MQFERVCFATPVAHCLVNGWEHHSFTFAVCSLLVLGIADGIAHLVLVHDFTFFSFPFSFFLLFSLFLFLLFPCYVSITSRTAFRFFACRVVFSTPAQFTKSQSQALTLVSGPRVDQVSSSSISSHQLSSFGQSLFLGRPIARYIQSLLHGLLNQPSSNQHLTRSNSFKTLIHPTTNLDDNESTILTIRTASTSIRPSRCGLL